MTPIWAWILMALLLGGIGAVWAFVFKGARERRRKR